MTKATKESYTDELGSLFGDLAKDDDALATFSDNDLGETKDWVPTLIPALDKNLVAGIPASGEISEMYGAPSTGKAVTNGTLIPTPKGAVPVEDIKVGDYVFDRLGKPTKVLGVYPQGKLDVYKVTLKDRRELLVNNEHIWSVYTSRGHLIDKTTQELIDSGISTDTIKFHHPAKDYNFSIPNSEWVMYDSKELKVDPYVLGALLGDGCLSERRLTISSDDEYVVNKVNSRLRKNTKATHKGSTPYSWEFKYNDPEDKKPYLRTRDLFEGVIETPVKSLGKYIPDEYLYNSKDNRVDLLNGLMDTDGSAFVSGGTISVVYSTISPQLADGIASLARSLGYYVLVRSCTPKNKEHEEYSVSINGSKEQLLDVFTLPKKRDIVKNNKGARIHYDKTKIVDISATGDKAEMTCLYVDNPEHLFLAGDYIVTHNTTFSGMLMHNAQKMGIVPVYFDVETTQSASRLKELGVDPRYVMTVKPKRLKDKTMMPLYIEDIGQKMIEIAAKIHDRDKNLITMFVWDSVAMTQPKMAAESDLDQQLVGQQAKALAVIGRKLQVNLAANNAFLLAFNQARDDFNAPNPKYAVAKTVGGKGWNHLLSTQILLKKGAKIKAKASDKEAIGQETKVTITKSKVGDNATDEVTIDLLGATGFDAERNLIVSANDLGLVEGSNWMTYVTDNGEKIKLQGKIAWTEYLKSDEASAVRTELWQKVLLTYFPKCYPPLFNLHARLTVDKFPEIEGLRKYYSDIQEQLPEDEQDYNYRTYMKAGLPLD